MRLFITIVGIFGFFAALSLMLIYGERPTGRGLKTRPDLGDKAYTMSKSDPSRGRGEISGSHGGHDRAVTDLGAKMGTSSRSDWPSLNAGESGVSRDGEKPAALSQAKVKAGLRFKKIKVVGRTAQPRLDFTNDTLPVQRVDEPVGRDFLDRVRLPANDYSF